MLLKEGRGSRPPVPFYRPSGLPFFQAEEPGIRFIKCIRVFLLRLGLIGPEFKNTRMHVMKRMPGSSAWKNGRPEGR